MQRQLQLSLEAHSRYMVQLMSSQRGTGSDATMSVPVSQTHPLDGGLEGSLLQGGALAADVLGSAADPPPPHAPVHAHALSMQQPAHSVHSTAVHPGAGPGLGHAADTRHAVPGDVFTADMWDDIPGGVPGGAAESLLHEHPHDLHDISDAIFEFDPLPGDLGDEPLPHA